MSSSHLLAGAHHSPRELLDDLMRGEDPRASAGHNVRVAMLYPGQGAQYPGMARCLYEREAAFREPFDRCAAFCDLPLVPLIFADESSALDRTDATQPAIFAVEYALTVMLRSWGVQPDVVLGHSIGEYAAACAAGMLSVQDATRLVSARGRLMVDHCKPGSLLVLGAAESELRLLLREHPDVEVALRNGARNIVVGGSRKAVERFQVAADNAGLIAHLLPVSHAFHTRLMEPMLEPFARTTESLCERDAEVTFISSTTGAQLERAGASYWVEHVRRPVRFVQALSSLRSQAPEIVIEVGPGQVLTRLARRELGSVTATKWLTLLPRQTEEHAALNRAAAELWRCGAISAT